MDTSFHIPVLVAAVSQYLLQNPDGLYVDGTLGGGGHAEQILKHLSPKGKLIGFDMDNEAVEFSRKRLEKYGDQIRFVGENFTEIARSVRASGIDHIDGLLLDLGISGHQIDMPGRGFSFRKDERIDMRMDQVQKLDGWTVVNGYDQSRLADIFRKFGEERYSGRIAKRIAERRIMEPINSTWELRDVVESSVGKRFLNKSLARIFQAIRIEVNRELVNLQKILREAAELLNFGGRVVVISYHSLEDRIVKKVFRNESVALLPPDFDSRSYSAAGGRLRILTKKPVVPSREEIETNPRSRSAKLRAAERI